MALGRVRADRGVPGRTSRNPGAVVRLTRMATGQGIGWLTLDEARLLLGELQVAVRGIETEQTARREAGRAQEARS
ncbi:hypothetical protein GobsT_36940 [Gemmata obscuriglobus]|uniref:Uncharacterized protein n=1 Tax=Gemmata obscuriglobus TaxID=114 RepID=A0A2Z3GWS8_9BACT|nr:hypothetical protein [Gemmata obscuriglobus]AWM38193.1 hypothetical protein C1280_15175 [Gemmata obscuriglobus]QEG28906.1 hypothetical protein GobsT_36940 [Gemmata obscuriglobus]VTS07383.1 unnamed protein product [Gemmata obscuriglobus UQM 2246]